MLLGQAVGTAAALTIERNCLPCDIAEHEVERLQDILMDDDCFLPHFKRKISRLCVGAHLSGEGNGLECLRDGVDRPRLDGGHAWEGKRGDHITYTFERPSTVTRIRLVADSDLNRDTLPEPERWMNRSMFHNRLKRLQPSHVPKTLLKAFRITATFADGSSAVVAEEHANHQRLWRCSVHLTQCTTLTLETLETWGAETIRLFAFEAD